VSQTTPGILLSLSRPSSSALELCPVEHDHQPSDNEGLGRRKRADREYEMKQRKTTPKLLIVAKTKKQI
jgi:hypothetical protein